MYNRLMRKKDEEVIKKVVDKIIDSKVLLTGDGDFYVTTLKGEIETLTIRNLFSLQSSINVISITFHGSAFGLEDGKYCEKAEPNYSIRLFRNIEGRLMQHLFHVSNSNLKKSPSFKRMVEYIDENKHLILHNDKEYGKCHTLTDVDFI